MPEIEEMLRQYADAVVAEYDPARIVEPSERPEETSPPGRQRVLVAAGLLLVFGGLGTLFARQASRQSESISTDLSVSTTVPTTQQDFMPADQLHLLPTSDNWVMVSFDETDNPAEPNTKGSDVAVFDKDGSLLILTVQDSDAPGIALATARISEDYNRRSIRWTSDGKSFGLSGFDLGDASLRAAAAALVPSDDGWAIPGTSLVLSEPGGSIPAARSFQLQFAPIMDDGHPDLTRSVEQHTITGTHGDLYRTLGEASGLGVTQTAQIAGGGTAFTVTEGPLPYALHFANGQLTTWQTKGSDADLLALLQSLTPANDQKWSRSIENADGIRLDALEAAAETMDPIEIVSLPRFLLPKPWKLQNVWDTSLWTDEQRRQSQAMEEASNGQASYRIAWLQTFRLANNDEQLEPDVKLEIQESFESPYPAGHGDDWEPISIGEFEGFLSMIDNENGESAFISLRRGRTMIEITTGTLSKGDLTEFVSSLSARSADGLDGFDYQSDGFDASLDEAGFLPGAEAGASSWSTTWVNGDDLFHLVVHAMPPGTLEIFLANASFYGQTISTPVPGEHYVRIESNQPEEYVWYDQALGLFLLVRGGGPDNLEAIQQMEQVTEATWVEAVTPFIEPPVLGGGN